MVSHADFISYATSWIAGQCDPSVSYALGSTLAEFISYSCRRTPLIAGWDYRHGELEMFGVVVSLIAVATTQSNLGTYSAGVKQSDDNTAEESEEDNDTPDETGVIYGRVSSPKQAQEGKSLNAQVDEMREVADRFNVELVHEPLKDAGKTGQNFKRPGIRKVFSLAQEGAISRVLVDDVSRLGRAAPQTLYFTYVLQQECGVRIITESGELNLRRIEDLLTLAMKALVSHMSVQYRARSALRSRKKGFVEDRNWNSWFSAVPLGYSMGDDAWLMQDPAEAEAVAAMFEQFLRFESYAKTTEYLNTHHADEIGEKLTYHQVKSYLQNPVYVGEPTIEHGVEGGERKERESVTDTSLRIVDWSTFSQTASLIREKTERASTDRTVLNVETAKDEFGLFPVLECSDSIKLVCRECGQGMRRNGQRSLAKEYRAQNYQCTSCGTQRKFPYSSEFEEMVERSDTSI